MQENFLHYLWKFQKFSKTNLRTENGERLEIIKQGTHNLNAGPDFFNAQIKVGDQLWAGNVEIHLKSSDWYAHHHEKDTSYYNVILHVVWEHDVEVYRRDNSVIPTLILKNRADRNSLDNYYRLFSKREKWIPCEDFFAELDGFHMYNWLERLYFERLEHKSETILHQLKASKNDWEAVLFKMLAKNFGLKNNADSFLSITNSVDFSVIRKLQEDKFKLEALLFGQVGLLEEDVDDTYFKKLKSEYAYLQKKFVLKNTEVLPVVFFRLRPVNFPTIRLAQLASVYASNPCLFSKLTAIKNKEDAYALFDRETSVFWDTHYHFQSVSSKRKKRITKAFIDLILINTVVPLLFCYARYTGKEISETIISLMSSISQEKNSIVSRFNDLKPLAENALHSQGLLELKKNYCDQKKCLDCAVGASLLNEK